MQQISCFCWRSIIKPTKLTIQTAKQLSLFTCRRFLSPMLPNERTGKTDQTGLEFSLGSQVCFVVLSCSTSSFISWH